MHEEYSKLRQNHLATECLDLMTYNCMCKLIIVIHCDIPWHCKLTPVVAAEAAAHAWLHQSRQQIRSQIIPSIFFKNKSCT